MEWKYLRQAILAAVSIAIFISAIWMISGYIIGFTAPFTNLLVRILTGILALFAALIIILVIAVISVPIGESLEKMMENSSKVLARLLTLDNMKRAIKLTAFIYSASFVLSIICEMIYFRALDIPMSGVPMSLVDRFSTSAGQFIVFLASSIVVFIFLPAAILTIEEIFRTSKKLHNKVNSLKRLMLLVAISSMIAYGCLLLYSFDIPFSLFHSHITEDFRFLIIYILILMLSIIFIGSVYYRFLHIQNPQDWQTEDRKKRFTYLSWTFAPFLVHFLFLQVNIWHLYAEISTKCPTVCPNTRSIYTFTISNGKSVNAVLARSFNNFFLIRNCESMKLEFLNSDNVIRVTKSP